MYSGISTPGPDHLPRTASQASQRLLDHRLHRPTLGLLLPAAEAAAVEFENEQKSALHQAPKSSPLEEARQPA